MKLSVIQTLPHRLQRYDTVGDWQILEFPSGPRFTIRVSETGDWKLNFLIGLHELIEATLCKSTGVTEAQVDAWDLKWDAEGEPGEDPRAPYYHQHQFASTIERMVASAMGVNWEAYEARIREISP